jgi:hypothetical protein
MREQRRVAREGKIKRNVVAPDLKWALQLPPRLQLQKGACLVFDE